MKGMRPLTSDEVRDVSRSFSGLYAARNKALFMMGVRTGFRISELLSLQLGDVLQRGKVIDVVSVRRANMKKKIEGRSVDLHPEAKAALQSWLNKRPGAPADEPLFLSQKGGAMTPVQAWQVLQDAYEANGLSKGHGTHAMRKTFANRVYNYLDRDLVKTQAALGHKAITSTVSYLSFAQSDVRAAILGC